MVEVNLVDASLVLHSHLTHQIHLASSSPVRGVVLLLDNLGWAWDGSAHRSVGWRTGFRWVNLRSGGLAHQSGALPLPDAVGVDGRGRRNSSRPRWWVSPPECGLANRIPVD